MKKNTSLILIGPATSFMGSLLNLGSMPLVYKIGSESFTEIDKKRFGLMLLRGFGFCMLWSPYFVNVGLVMVLYDLSWQQIGGAGIMAAVLYSMVVAVFFRFTYFKKDTTISNEEKTSKNYYSFRSDLRKLGLYVILLILLSFSLDVVLNVSMLTIVSVLALIYPFIWAAGLRLFQDYIIYMKQQVHSSFTRLYNELAIFITAGFFGKALSISEAGDWLSQIIYILAGETVFWLILLLIGFAMLFAFLGVHPVIIIIGLGSSLTPEQFNVSPAFMGMLMLAAWSLATQISPFSGSVLLASNLINISPWKLVQKNAVFIFTVMMMFTMYLSLLHYLDLL
ncbi:TRAP transporter large permease subunit [Alteribacillus sp. HJP-4]|uniref:TRAP transporter large permease subunit n=1 Tax=Alteribacillus sp. HJP-4 TaxID=2775394 RepID=UPI0035CCFEDF